MATELPFKAEDYTVGWICALPVELAASAELLDKEHPQLPHDTKDSNSYTYGSIGDHNVVIGCLPFGQIGLVSAASVAIQMKSRFQSIRFGLMVGIGGGVPSENADIRLGDVVVSVPSGQYGGVVQYDLGKTLTGGQNIRTGSLNAPPQILLTALAAVEAARLRDKFHIEEYLLSLGTRLPKFAYPQTLQDHLYKSIYPHPKGATCAQCSEDQLEERHEREDTNVAFHYGTIASGNQVMKDGVERDRLSSALDGVLCFEMEAAGLMNNFPCLVIRGICDYADSHKNKGWQPYAAATAAAFAKGLLELIPATEVAMEPTIKEAMKDLTAMVAENNDLSKKIEERISSGEADKILQWLSATTFSKPQNTARETRTPGTGHWLLQLETYTDWREHTPGLLWIHGAAGSGKTVLCSTAIDDIQKKERRKLAYWYFQFSNDATLKVGNLLRSLIRQLSTIPLLDGINRLWHDHNRTGSEPGSEELAKVLDELIESHKEPVFIVMDALDECPQTPDQPERVRLLDFLLNLSGKHRENLHILITSRPEHDIHSALMSYPSINLEEFVASDVKHFVKSSLQSGDLKIWSVDIKQEIEERLLSIEAKRFRWADLQIRRLQSCYTNDQIQEAMRTIPESLEAAYEEALNNIPRKDAKIARWILMWLACSFRPMTINEIAAAVGLPHPEFVLRICTSMLVTLIHEHTDTVIKLAHFSVKEYLVMETQKGNTNEESFGYQFSSELAHATIGNSTISYIIDTNTIDVSEQTVIEKPLLPYSADYWFQHVAAIGDYITDFPQLSERIAHFFSQSCSQSYLNWHKLCDWDDNEHAGPYHSKTELPNQCPPPLYYASLFGFDHSVQTLIERDDKIPAESEIFENACVAGSIHGHSKVVAKLLSDRRCHLQQGHILTILRGVKTNAKGIIKTLLDAGVLNSAVGESKDDVQISDLVLETAAANWENGFEITKALLDHLGSSVHITEAVIQAAARNGLSGGEVVRLLLDRRSADVQITDKVTQAAAGNRMNGVEVMTLLLDRKASDVHISKEVVEEAAKNTKSGKKVLALLLERVGSDIRNPEQVLEAIVETFDDDITNLFLDRNSNVRITEEVMNAALRNSKHRQAIVKLLVIGRGFDGQIPEEFQEALGMWVYEGKAKIALIEANTSLSNPKGKLALKITGARGLRTSNEVYVVVGFQHNEFISKNLPVKSLEVSGDVLIQVPTPDTYIAQPAHVIQRRRSSVISLPDHQTSDTEEHQSSEQVRWNIEVVFDVVDSDPQVSIMIYGRENAKETFLGHAHIEAHLTENDSPFITGWFKLNGRSDIERGPWGEVNVELNFQQIGRKQWSPTDFQVLRLIGKGTYGQVFQVQKKDTRRIYAMKVVAKKMIVRKKEVAHILGERNILVRAAITNSPFLVGLKFAFQTPTDLYLVTDFMGGGELFWHLQKEGRFIEERTKFYVAELVLALQHLHSHGIIYRDLKPENILLDANGHIALSDFSLSKVSLTSDTTNSFCGTTEYLAPEVLLDEKGYTKMVDFWSLGVLTFEMCCGWSPFWAEDTHQMYRNIAFGKVRFPRDALSTEGRAFVKGLINRNPKHRLGATNGADELRRHPFFSNIDWDALAKKLTPPPFKPMVKDSGNDADVADVANFDPEFLRALGAAGSTPLSASMQAAFKGFTFVDEEDTLDRRFSNDGDWDKEI